MEFESLAKISSEFVGADDGSGRLFNYPDRLFGRINYPGRPRQGPGVLAVLRLPPSAAPVARFTARSAFIPPPVLRELEGEPNPARRSDGHPERGAAGADGARAVV